MENEKENENLEDGTNERMNERMNETCFGGVGDFVVGMNIDRYQGHAPAGRTC